MFTFHSMQTKALKNISNRSFNTFNNRHQKNIEIKNEEKVEELSENSDSVYVQKETKLKAGFHQGRIIFNMQTTTTTNSDFFRYDYGKWIMDFIETISHRTEMKKAQENVWKFGHDLEEIRKVKSKAELDLEGMRESLSKIRMEKSAANVNGIASMNYLRICTKENEIQLLKDEKMQNFKQLKAREQLLVIEFAAAVKDSIAKEAMHSRFLKATIFVSIFITLTLTLCATYIYNTLKKVDTSVQQMENFNILLTEIKSKKEETKKEGWGPYLKSWVRPVYSWALPKNN